jgi:hypothetical protein
MGFMNKNRAAYMKKIINTDVSFIFFDLDVMTE